MSETNKPWHPEQKKGQVIVAVVKKDVAQIFFDSSPIPAGKKFMHAGAYISPHHVFTEYETIMAYEDAATALGIKPLETWPPSILALLSAKNETANKPAVVVVEQIPPDIAPPVDITPVIAEPEVQLKKPEPPVVPEVEDTQEVDQSIEQSIEKTIPASKPATKTIRRRGPGKKKLKQKELLEKTLFSEWNWDPRNPDQELFLVINEESTRELKNVRDPDDRQPFKEGKYRLRPVLCTKEASEKFPNGTRWYVNRLGFGLPFGECVVLFHQSFLRGNTMEVVLHAA